MKLALVERELRRQALRKAPYVLRIAAALVAFTLLLFLWVMDEDIGTAQAEQLGRWLYGISVSVQAVAATLVPLLITPDLIAKEKQERTLGLLLLAEPRGYAIYFSKLLLAFVYAESIILGVLPTLALGALLGGFEVPRIVGQTFIFSVAALTYCCAGLFFSTIASRPGQALIASILFTAAWIGAGTKLFQQLIALSIAGPLITGGNFKIWITEPTLLALMYNDLADLKSPGFWVPLSLIALLIPATIFLLPRQTSGPSKKAKQRSRTGRRRLRILPQPPVAQLLNHGTGGLLTALRPWPLRLLAAGLLLFLTPFYLFGALFLLALISYDVASTIQRARESGILDDVRMAIPDRHALILNVYRALLGRSLLYLPALATLGVFGFMPVYLPLFDVRPGQNFSSGIPDALILLGPWLLLGYFQLRLIVAVGLEKSVGEGSAGGKAARSVRHLIGVCVSACLVWIVFIFIGAVLVSIAGALLGPFPQRNWDTLFAFGTLCAGSLSFYFSSNAALTLLPAAFREMELR